jgi:TonB family protein
VSVAGRPLRADAGVVDEASLVRRLGAPLGDGVVVLEVDDAVLTSALAVVVQACLRGGYQIGLVPSPDSSPALIAVEADEPAATLMGSIDKESVRRVIRANRSAARACYDTLLTTKPGAAGKVLVKFVVSASGEVTSTSVSQDSVGDEALVQCLSKTLKTWVFPKPVGGGVVIISYPFVFKPEAAR